MTDGRMTTRTVSRRSKDTDRQGLSAREDEKEDENERWKEEDQRREGVHLSKLHLDNKSSGMSYYGPVNAPLSFNEA